MLTRRAAATCGAALSLALAAPVTAPVAAQAAVAGPTAPVSAAPGAPDCPYRQQPGPPVDRSEVPQPGQAPPRPLPVPAQPVGGPAMGWCGVVVHRTAPAPPAVGVVSYVVADLDSGEVLAARDAHARLRPASLMKTLTALLVARDVGMDEVITGTQEDADQEGTRVGLGPGGRYTVRSVFDAMLMASGNDAAHALAVRHSGSADAMVADMNRTAAAMGALDTRAATPSGLDGPGMQTSAYDLASIFRAGMAEPEFARAVATRQITLPGYGGRPPVPVSNDNKLQSYPGFLGGKTGFTDDARHTFIGSAQRDGRRLVAVLMRGEQRPVRMTEQAAALLDYGFARSAAQSIGRLTERAPRAAGDDSSAGAAGADGAAPAAAAGGPNDWRIPLTIAVVVVAIGALVGLRLRDRR